MRTYPTSAFVLAPILTALLLGFLCLRTAKADSFTRTGAMSADRDSHTATLLPNGKVLVAGGSGGTNLLASAELYDPVTGTWATTGAMNTNRASHTATLLPNGQVLVAGGYTPIGDHVADATWSAELYDPGTGIWTATGGLHGGHAFHTATLLLNGKVLVVGWAAHGVGPSAELYDPASGTWTATGTVITSRTDHTATLLPNGKVLVVGGQDNYGAVIYTAELFDPGTGTWTAANSTLFGHRDHEATLLSNGKVLVVGNHAELFDWTTGLWTATGAMAEYKRCRYLTATLLPSGKVLAAGGESYTDDYFDSAELYNPTTGLWAPTGSLNALREGHTATLLPDGNVLVAGGFNGATHLSSAELYDSANTTVDAGLRAYDGSVLISFACESALQPTSPLRITKNFLTYGIRLVPTNSPDASRFRIQTSSGTKALMKMP